MIDKADGMYYAECDKCSEEYPDSKNDLDALRYDMGQNGWRCMYDPDMKSWDVICAKCMEE